MANALVSYWFLALNFGNDVVPEEEVGNERGEDSAERDCCIGTAPLFSEERNVDDCSGAVVVIGSVSINTSGDVDS